MERQTHLGFRQDAQAVFLGHGLVALSLEALGNGQEGGGIDSPIHAKGGFEFIFGVRNPCTHIFG